MTISPRALRGDHLRVRILRGGSGGGLALSQLGADVVRADPPGGASDTTRWSDRCQRPKLPSRVGDGDDLVFAVGFGPVHGVVGAGDEPVEVFAGCGEGDSDAEREGEVPTQDRDG